MTVSVPIQGAQHQEIAIVMGPLWETWSPHDVETRGLGGTETAAVRVAKELAQLGHDVAVYGEVRSDTVNGVAYRHISTFDPADPRLAVVVSRHPEYFDHPINAQATMFWMHDPSYENHLTPERGARIDHCLALNDWHFERVLKTSPFMRERLRMFRNGIEWDYFKPRHNPDEGHRSEPQRRKRVVYTSGPTRGIDILLELWPRIHTEVPDAELAYCHADVYNGLANIKPELAEHRTRIRELTEEAEGVRALGSLAQPELARLLLSSLVWAHPSWATPYGEPFYETGPMSAMEAQAAGCVVVASKWGGLMEAVKVGCLIDAEPPGERWRDAFVREIVDGLTNPETQARAQTRGPEAVAGLGWRGVAEQMIDLIDRGAPD